jgi:hypothetical protein
MKIAWLKVSIAYSENFELSGFRRISLVKSVPYRCLIAWVFMDITKMLHFV